MHSLAGSSPPAGTAPAHPGLESQGLQPVTSLSAATSVCLMALPSDCSGSWLRDLCRPLCVPAQGVKPVKRCFELLKELMELGRASSVWQVIPKLCLPLLPSPQLPARVLSVFFYVLALFFPALPPVAPLWLSKGTPAPARPGRRKAQVGSSPVVLCLPLLLSSVVSQ